MPLTLLLVGFSAMFALAAGIAGYVRRGRVAAVAAFLLTFVLCNGISFGLLAALLANSNM